MQRAALADHRDDIGRRRRENEREAAVCATGEAGQRVHRARMEIEDAPAPPREGRGAARACEYGRTAGSISAAALLQRFCSASAALRERITNARRGQCLITKVLLG